MLAEAVEVAIYQATIRYGRMCIVEGKPKQLTRSIAKQFPIHSDSRRIDAAMTGQKWPKPICKVLGRTVETGRPGWLLLIVDDEAGLAWFPPICPTSNLTETMLARGGWVDDLAAIPTVIL